VSMDMNCPDQTRRYVEKPRCRSKKTWSSHENEKGSCWKTSQRGLVLMTNGLFLGSDDDETWRLKMKDLRGPDRCAVGNWHQDNEECKEGNGVPSDVSMQSRRS
jgi:hypothetical protein